MKRVWIHFTERQQEALREDARRRRIPLSEVVRQLVAAHYGLEHEAVKPGIAYRSPEGIADES